MKNYLILILFTSVMLQQASSQSATLEKSSCNSIELITSNIDEGATILLERQEQRNVWVNAGRRKSTYSTESFNDLEEGMYRTTLIYNSDAIMISNIVYLDCGSRDSKRSIVSIYPQPASDQISITRSEDFSEAGFTIYAIDGKVILSGQLSSDVSSINISELSDGMYIIQLVNILNESSTEKFTIHK